jgi:hypothetical protein
VPRAFAINRSAWARRGRKGVMRCAATGKAPWYSWRPGTTATRSKLRISNMPVCLVEATTYGGWYERVPKDKDSLETKNSSNGSRFACSQPPPSNDSFRNMGTVGKSLPSRFFISVLVHEIFGIEVEIHSDFSIRRTAAASQPATLFRRHPVCIKLCIRERGITI